MPRFSRDSRIAFWLFGLFSALYVLSMGGHGYGGVGTTTYEVTRALILKHSVAIAPVPWGQYGRDGQFYAQYGIGHSLYNLPFYLLGHVVTRLVPSCAAHADRLTLFTTLLGQPIISAVTCALLFLCGRKLGLARRIAVGCALLYGLGTQAWMYAQLDFSEPILTACLLAGVYWLLPENFAGVQLSDRACMLAGLCLGLAITVKIAAVILLPGWLLWLSGMKRRNRWRKIGLFLLPVSVVGFGIVGAYNWLRFGNPLATGYDQEFTWYVKDILWHGWQNFGSLEGSLFLYSPVILLALPGQRQFWRQHRRTAGLLWGSIATLLAFYPFTTNELYYGPRYLTPTLPYFLLMSGATLERALTASPAWLKWAVGALLALGMAQQLVGVTVNYHTYYWRIQYAMPLADAAWQRSEIGQRLRQTPQLPHLLGHLWLLKHGLGDVFTPGGMPLAGVTLLPDRTAANAWIPYYGLDLWWLHPKFLAIAGVLGTGLVVIGLLGGIGFALYGISTMPYYR